MSHEKAVARSSRDSCLRGCQRLGAKDYAACEMRCRLEAAVSDWDSHDHDHDGIVDHDSEDHHSDSSEEDVAERGAGHDWRTNQQFSHATYTGNERPRGPKLSHEKAVARSSRDSCLRGCQRLGAKDYAACEMRCRLEA